MTRRKLGWTLGTASLVLLTLSATHAADHLDAPLLTGNGDSDINDIYAFQSPANPDNTVLIMTVNPFAGVLSGETFDENVSYDFSIDNDGDAVADVTYSTTFGAPSGGVQSLTTLRNGSSYASGNTGMNLSTSGGGTLVAGVYDDPFFFDLAGFQNSLAFTGVDAFAGANVSAIVLELPSTELNGATSNVGIWATTSEAGMQIDRKGRPAINTVLIPSARKDEFNQADPANDLAAFGADVEAAITGLSDATNAAALTPILLPDVLTFDTADASGFLNGRQLADDVIDAELTLLTASSSPIGDGVDANDLPFSNAFPYLAPAHTIIPEPSAITLAVVGMSMVAGRRRRS